LRYFHHLAGDAQNKKGMLSSLSQTWDALAFLLAAAAVVLLLEPVVHKLYSELLTFPREGYPTTKVILLP
jgi:hypothetical protein